MVLKRIGALSCAKIMGVLYAIIGLVLGGLFSLFAMIGLALGAGQRGEPGEAILGLFFGMGAVIFLPVFYGVLGFIGGLISAALYNVLAGVIGGVELELESAPR